MPSKVVKDTPKQRTGTAITVRVSPEARQSFVEYVMRISDERGKRITMTEAMQEIFLQLKPSRKR